MKNYELCISFTTYTILFMKVILNKKVQIIGAVQGVGFRPFIYKIAKQLNLVGEVYNDSAGVIIVIQCSQEQLNKFLILLKTNLPPLTKIVDISVKDNDQTGQFYKDFSINQSSKGKVSTTVLPDACICSDCIADIIDKNNRRYDYAFTNCTNCGPRFSIIKDIPYDRKSTSMSAFSMCIECKQEYQNPLDRRFHAQPNTCPNCGPQLQLTDATGKNVITNNNNILDKTVSLLKQGKIIVVKGIGGFHLACLASRESSVITLRNKKIECTNLLL